MALFPTLWWCWNAGPVGDLARGPRLVTGGHGAYTHNPPGVVCHSPQTEWCMRYKLLGRSGLRVSEVCLGTMTFGERWGFGAPREECEAIYNAFVEAGGNFVDTANRYTEGDAETMLGEFMAPHRQKMVVATKYSLSMDPNDPNASGNHRKNLVQSVEASLRRMGTDYVDVLMLHMWDGTTPVDEVMRGLEDVVASGKALHVGISDTPAWVVSQANTVAELRGWHRFTALQVEYSLIERTAELDLLPMARAHQMGVMAWGALAAGLLTGKWTQGKDPRWVDSRRHLFLAHHNNERDGGIAAAVDEVANDLGSTSARVALAWVMHQAPQVIPVVGARRASQIADSLQAVDLVLEPEHLQALANVSMPPAVFPHAFLKMAITRNTLYGNLTSQMAFLDE